MECARVSVIRPELALAQGVRTIAVRLAYGRAVGYDIEGLAR